MNKRWIVKQKPSEEQIAHLIAEINVSEPVASMLLQRGVHSFEEAKNYFRPSLELLHDPFLMKDMDKAVNRLVEAIYNHEKIVVYGDYDVDGTTSVALFYGFLRTFYSNLLFYIPDRYKEGYGISQAGIEWANEQGATLMVSLDCGIKSKELIQYAKEKGIDFIICDHHRPDNNLPDALAVLDPKRSDCEYPYKELSGCGVGFKLLQGFCIQNSIPFEKLYPFMDLLAVSIAADIVPITGENRIMAYFGLQLLNTHPRPGLQALIQIAGFEKKLSISNVVFGLGPRINAAGRIAHAHAAVHLLLAHSKEEAEQHAKEINLNNRDRQGFDTNITREALNMIEMDELMREAKTTVLYKNDWHKGVIGIVASRCIEKYHRPTIILTESHSKAAGSARSVPGFDVYDAIEECKDLLEQFGGHMYAAGLTLKLENVQAFRQKFEEVVARKITEDQLIPLIEVDLELKLKQINFKFYNVIKQMEPFGPENMQPIFVSEQVCARDNVKVLKDQHLKLYVYQEDSQVFEAIGFGMAAFYGKIKPFHPFRLCYQIVENNFRDNRSLQLLIKDIKFYE
ncbi:single-stranded-DNA-specific exonuclease RecJ [Rhodocytophaga aerolata]|uniref:Single-stranded-DNA-specific exonuclease RecJ n=1 Tax=Rhodocytophaga aerolata TaxID=455078 RepID=A0ABT8R2H5_9BACT|nr:single-stranded-DNA-specific exonuclease RecJ [Rhodocytophaga aerolata]MDO1446297.1 single-stranded-DNA-specific exonuclease RecJ [Rhodocytophaga aerolata]